MIVEIALYIAPFAADAGRPLARVVGGLSLALFVAGIVSPHAGDGIEGLSGLL